MAVGNAFPLHQILTAGRGADQSADNAVWQEIHFIYIENILVGTLQQTAGKLPHALFDRALEIDGAHQHILGDTQGQIHHTLLGQSRHAAHNGGLGRSLFSAQQYAADSRFDQVIQQCFFYLLLPHNGSKGVTQISH